MERSDTIRRNIGLRIVELRRGERLTQERLAERLSIDTRDLRRIEGGEVNLTIDTIVKIANALGVATRDLLRAPRSAVKRRPGRPRP